MPLLLQLSPWELCVCLRSCRLPRDQPYSRYRAHVYTALSAVPTWIESLHCPLVL